MAAKKKAPKKKLSKAKKLERTRNLKIKWTWN
jgi:hypothetical protein